MKIAIIGAGAIGSVVAGYLVKSGREVLLIGRPPQVEIINKKGLLIKRSDGAEKISLTTATRLKGHYDLVIFTVKTQDLEQAYQENRKYLEDGLILTTQNGVQADNLLSTHFLLEKMISSIVMFGATYMNPGEVIFNFPGDWIIGRPFGPNDDKVSQVAEILKEAFPVVISHNIMGMKWLKLFVNFNNCIPAVIGKSMQETFSDMDFCRLSIKLLKEGMEIVHKANIELVSLPQFPAERIFGLSSMPLDQAAAIMQKTLTTLSKEPLYGSILQSIKRHKSSEIDFINGEVTQIAKNIRMESPLNRKIVDLVHQVEQRGKFLKPEELKREFN